MLKAVMHIGPYAIFHGPVNLPCILNTILLYKRDSLVAFVALLFYVHGKHLRSCRDGQLT